MLKGRLVAYARNIFFEVVGTVMSRKHYGGGDDFVVNRGFPINSNFLSSTAIQSSLEKRFREDGYQAERDGETTILKNDGASVRMKVSVVDGAPNLSPDEARLNFML